MEKILKPEKECPRCKGVLVWKVVRNPWGSPLYNGLCKNCNIVLRGRETPEITAGKNLERKGRIDGVKVKDISAMDKRIASLPCDVQLGILRQRQHKIGLIMPSRNTRMVCCRRCKHPNFIYEDGQCEVCGEDLLTGGIERKIK